MTRTPLPGPHEGPMRPYLTHLRPLSAAISTLRCKAGREPALGAAIYRFSRAVRAPSTIQINPKRSRSLHPSPVRRRATRLRAPPPSSTPSRSLSCPCRRRCARRYRALALDVPSNGVRARARRKGKGRGGSVEPLRPTRESDWSSVPAEITNCSPAPPTLSHPPIGSILQKRVWPDF